MTGSWEKTETYIAQARELLDRAQDVGAETVESASARAGEIVASAERQAIDPAVLGELHRRREQFDGASRQVDADLRELASALRGAAGAQR